MMKKFRIYYGDGTEVEGTTIEEWKKAPSGNIQVVLVKHEDDRVERWNSQEIYVIDDEMAERVTARDPEVKRGKWLDDKLFHPLYDKVKLDEDVF